MFVAVDDVRQRVRGVGGGEAALFVIGCVPVRARFDSIISGSVGRRAALRVAEDHVPAPSIPELARAQEGQSEVPVRLSSVAMSCQGTPTMPESTTRDRGRAGLPPLAANKGLSTAPLSGPGP